MPTHDHDHSHNHLEQWRRMSRRRLMWALLANLLFMVVEIVGGLMANSLALLADAGHMVTDVAALALAIIVARLAERPPSARRTFGLLRAEVLGAFVNGASMVLIVGYIVWEAWNRLGQPHTIDGPLVAGIALVGLVVNVASAWLLARDRKHNVNVQGAFLHMLADSLGSVGALVAGVVIWQWGWTLIDPLVSVFIGALILWSSRGLIRSTLNILLEATPEDIDFDEVKAAIESIDHVEEVHDLHIWTIASGIPSLSAHLRLNSCCSETRHWHECLRAAQDMLSERFGIVHSTLQIEPMEYKKDARTI